MENSQLQLSSTLQPTENFPTPSPSTPHSYNRHSLVARRFRDALFSAVAARYTTNGSDHSLPFLSEQLKSDIERRLHEHLPSFHTPTHLPYASMIQRAIAEVGEEDGLSEESISEFIVNEFEDLPWAHPAFLGRHLGKLCESGELVKSKCGKYNFKVEGKEIKRKKRRRKSSGRSRRREVKSADETEEVCDRKKRSKKLMIIGPRSEEVVTSKGTEEQNDSLREVIVGAEDGDKAQGGQVVMDELEEVQEDEIVDDHHGKEIKYKDGPTDLDWQKQLRNQVIVALQAPVTIKGKRSGSLRKEVHEAEEGDHVKGGQMLGELKEVWADVMIDQHCAKEVKSRDAVQDFDEKKQSQNAVASKIGAQKVLTTAKCGLSREEFGGAKVGGYDQERQVIMIYKLEEVRKVGRINDHQEVEVKSRDGSEDFCGRKQSQDLMVVGLHAEKALTTKGTEDQCSLSRKKVDGAEGDHAQAGQTEVLDKFEVVQEIEMVYGHHEEERKGEMVEEPTERASKGSNEHKGPSEEATLDFFDAISNHGNVEENEMIDAQGCKKLQEENKNLEFFDAKSDHGDNGANEKIGAQSSKGKVLGEVSNKQNRRQLLSKLIDDQTGTSKGCEAEDPQLPKEQPQVRWPSEMTGTPSTSIAASRLFEYQMEAPKHSKQGMPSPSEVDKNENSETLLPSDIICSPKSYPRGHRGRGRPRKLKVQETLATSLSSSAQDCDQQNLESNVEGREKFGPGDVSSLVDQQQLKLPRGRGGGRGRGRPQVVKQDQTSVSETFSRSSHLHHQQSFEKRRRGRPPKQKLDEDGVPKDISTTLENGQQEQKGRGCGCERPSR